MALRLREIRKMRTFAHIHANVVLPPTFIAQTLLQTPIPKVDSKGVSVWNPLSVPF